MIIDPSAIDWRDGYQLMISSILPRPIAFVSTISKQGVRNLAPFSFFTVVAVNPMTLCFSPMRRGGDGSKKDTLVNIEQTGEFVVNIVSERFVQEMNLTSAEFPPEVDEFAESGLTPAPSVVVKPPRVQESLVAYECRLLQTIEVGGDQPGAGALVLGTVVRLVVADEVLKGGALRLDLLQPIGRMAGSNYVRCTDLFALQRPAR